MSVRIGYFVHHQGRGHAERAAAIAHALDPEAELTLFSARADIFPTLPATARVVQIPSLFETPDDAAAALADLPTPDVFHCAPVGWRSITQAIATITAWFAETNADLFVTDVSAELALLARIASIPCVTVLQHGHRYDAGHRGAYESAIGLLAPYDISLEQADRPAWMLSKTRHFGGLGIAADTQDRAAARRRLGLSRDADIVVVVAGGGGTGTPATPLTLGARAEPASQWITIGEVMHEWHATPPDNLRHLGWVSDPACWIAAADRIVSSAGNTTVHMIAAAGRPWIVVPEWRYFDEQIAKARALAAAGVAIALDHWPAHVDAWRRAWASAETLDLAKQRKLVDATASRRAANWLREIAELRTRPGATQVQLVAEAAE